MEQEAVTKIPDWLTSNFLSCCLHSNKKLEKCIVTEFSAEPAVPPGNNFGSEIFRVKITLKEESNQNETYLSLIIKSPLSEGHYFDDFYSSEPKFYNQFLPEAYKLLNNSLSFAPNSFSSPIPFIVVLEDLKSKGFVMVDRLKQLDFEHCRLYVTSAATFHAASFAIHKQNPELILAISKEKMFSNGIKSVETSKNMIRFALDCLVDVMETQLDESCLEILRCCSISLWDMLVEAHKPNKSFNCLNQGDPWTANMMFKYTEEGKPSDIKIFDFQNLRYASPVCDLVFFIWSSANPEVRENRLNELYQIYLSTLNGCLTELKCSESLSDETFKEHVLTMSPMIVWIVATTLPIMLNPSPTDLKPLLSKLDSAYSPTDNPYKSLYHENFAQVHLPQLMKQFQTTGVFNFLKSKLHSL